MDQFNFLIAFITEFLCKAFHVSISHFRHQVMYSESAAFLKDSECLPKELLLIHSGYVVIYVIARNGIECLIRKIEMHRVAFFERNIRNTFCLSITLTQSFAE